MCSISPQTTFLPSVVMCTFQCTKWQLGPATAPGTYIQVCVYINEQGGFPHTTIVCNHLCESVCVCTCVAAAKQNTEEAIGIFTCKSCESAEGGGPYFRYSWLAVGEQSQLTS